MALYLSLAIALQAGQYFRIIILSSVTTLASELSTCVVNLLYFLQPKRESFYRGQSGNYLYRITKSYNRITLSAQRRRRNPKPVRLSYITLLSALSRQQVSIYFSQILVLGYIFKQRAFFSTSRVQRRKQPFPSFRKPAINYINVRGRQLRQAPIIASIIASDLQKQSNRLSNNKGLYINQTKIRRRKRGIYRRESQAIYLLGR